MAEPAGGETDAATQDHEVTGSEAPQDAATQDAATQDAATQDAATQGHEVTGSEVPARPRKAWAWAVVACYLAGAVAVTWQLWRDPAGRAQVIPGNGISRDVALFAWFMRYAATAVAHWHLPALVTRAVNAPQGINVMWNTSFLLPGVLLAPVTLLAGPQVSLTIMTTLSFAGSAAAMFFVLRRWGAGLGPAALGGALYGFSPAMRMMAVGHYHLMFAVLPPLIIDALLRIVTGRAAPFRTGIWLGLLVAAQLFIGEEPLLDTAITAVIILVVLAASRPRAVAGQLRASATGLAVAVVAALAICGHPLWVQFHGALASHGSPWDTAEFFNSPGQFVTAPNGMLWHSQQTAVMLAAHPVLTGEYDAYLGWPLLVVLLLAVVCCWRDLRVRVMGVTFAIVELFTLGTRTVRFPGFSYPAALLPWHWLQRLPLLSNLLPNRLSLLADGAAAVVLACALQRALHAAPAAGRWQWRSWRWRSCQWRSWQGRSWRYWWRPAAAAVALLAVLPLIPLQLQTSGIAPVPSGWARALASLRLPPMARVLVIPVVPAQTMEWQAQTGAPISLIGGYCIAPSPSGQAERCSTIGNGTAAHLNPPPDSPLTPGATGRIEADLAYWQPAAVVAVAARGSRLERFLGKLFGRAGARVGSVVVWHGALTAGHQL
jgi:hypothetical protein